MADATSLLTPGQRRFLEGHRVARLATVDARGRPHVVPICFVVIGNAFYTPLDEKPKTVPPTELRRVRNLLRHPEVAVVVDNYSEDWSRLAYLLLRGTAGLLQTDEPEHAAAVQLLREKYPQYRAMAIDQRPVIRVALGTARGWSAGGWQFDEDPGKTGRI
jgi:PPOX class probable F420-dependent enzyme